MKAAEELQKILGMSLSRKLWALQNVDCGSKLNFLITRPSTRDPGQDSSTGVDLSSTMPFT